MNFEMCMTSLSHFQNIDCASDINSQNSEDVIAILSKRLTFQESILKSVW